MSRAALAYLATRLAALSEVPASVAAAAAAAASAQASANSASAAAREHWIAIGGQAPVEADGFTGNQMLHTDGVHEASDGTVFPDDVLVTGFQYLVQQSSGHAWTGHGGDAFAAWAPRVNNGALPEVLVPLDAGNPRVSGFVTFSTPIPVTAGQRFSLQWRPGDMGGRPAVLRAVLVVRQP